ncbi:AraC family transcriptional regulator [Chishuiella changwenlii]|uniref:AraC family transcriptional regulator n=1 Tax=Chishuiella changwenlii TaxID=1434701 RepID=UPI002FD8CB2B
MTSIAYKTIQPDNAIKAFVENFWCLHNNSDEDKEMIILPDGRVDLTLFKADAESLQIIRSGIETYPDRVILKAHTLIFSISFKLTAVEYIFKDSIAEYLDYAEFLPHDYWSFNENDLKDFDSFCLKASNKIKELLPKDVDNRKQKLFDLIYATNGAITVQEISEKVSWSARQINRYFNQRFGISLKTYCKIIRFRSSFQHIKDGKLFPEENFSDQSHFIKEVKKLSGVSPKDLKINKNDRFIQFSTLRSK